MKIIIFSVLLIFSINGFAVNWKKFGENSMGYSYVDVDNIKKLNNVVYYWRLFDYLNPSPIGVHSSISKFTVDCVVEKLTWISSSYFSQPMGKGSIIKEKTSNKTLYPRPNTVEYETMKFACEYKKLSI
jgi:hypothetical protein